jgi:multiple sugar transport system substrate-binding protein
MKNFKKSIILCLVVILSLSTLLLGCSSNNKNVQNNSGSNNSNVEPAKKEKEKDPVELTWLVRNEPHLLEWEEDTIKKFEAENPHIKVKLEKIPATEIDQRLTTMLASGNVPDVWSTNWSLSGFATYMHMGALLDLTPYVEQDPEVVDTITKNALDTYTIGGKIYGIPMLSLDTYLYYNKDMFDAAGLPYPTTDWDDKSWNFDKLLEYAMELTDPENQVYGFLDDDMPDRSSWHFGGDWYTEEAYETGIMGTPTVLRDVNIDTVQWYHDLIHKYKVSPSRATQESMTAIGNPFMTGKLAMEIRGGWGVWSYSDADFRWGIAAIPWHEGRKAPTYTDPWNISAKSKHPDEAWEFVKYLVDPEKGAKTFMEASNSVPVDSVLIDDWAAQMAETVGMTEEEVIQVHEGAQKYGKAYDGHLIAKRSVIYSVIRQTIDAVWNGEIEVEKGMQEIQNNLENLKLD